MLKRIPIVGLPITLRDLFSGFFAGKTAQINLAHAISKLCNLKYVYFTDSATSSLYVILEALKNKQHKKEVILPAYTATSLIIAIKKANLKPVLCDISLDNFQLDINLLSRLVSEKTLCIVGVHMFGIVHRDLGGLKEKFPDILIIEDCAQSLGSKINGVSIGNLADLSFFSFNRGKNLPTYGGGCITTNSEELSEVISQELKRQVIETGLGEKAAIILKNFALSLAVRPWVYGLSYPLISLFREIAPHQDFSVKTYTDFQAGVALSLLKRIEEFSQKRYANGMELIEGFKDIEDIILPKISADTQPAFNRLPILFKDLKRRQELEKRLGKNGIETSRMYFQPLHRLFDLGYKKEDFPNANYFAEHLLTLPVHPLVREKDLLKMMEIIKR